jgi:cell filamentation protein
MVGAHSMKTIFTPCGSTSPFLDFSVIAGEKRNDYFSAVKAGLGRNFSPMEGVFAEIIEETLTGS